MKQVTSAILDKLRKRAVILVLCYSFVLLCFSILTIYLFKMPIVKYLIHTLIQNPLILPIILIFTIGIIMSFATFINTVKEASVVEKIITNQNDISYLNGEIPLNRNIENSMFIDHFRKLSTSMDLNWTTKIKTNLEDYLEEMIFKATGWITHLEESLPLWGLLGTALGMAMACSEKSGNISIYTGVLNAIGTTIFALYGKLIIVSLNQIIISERSSLLKTILVIFRVNQRG